MHEQLPLIEPDWPAPAHVLACTTTRRGGVSVEPYATLNLGDHVGDAAEAVAANRARLAGALPSGTALAWLSQVHGVDVVEARPGGNPAQADAQWSRAPGVACTVLTADCLPVLFCDLSGTVVAAAHAGWRGLLAGVLEATVVAMHAAPDRIMAWLGPAIGPAAFEVGAEVRAAFLARADAVAAGSIEACFQPHPRRADHYLADLCALARLRLAAVGVSRVYGGGCCTHGDGERFFSYRRDGATGRMASLILLR